MKEYQDRLHGEIIAKLGVYPDDSGMKIIESKIAEFIAENSLNKSQQFVAVCCYYCKEEFQVKNARIFLFGKGIKESTFKKYIRESINTIVLNVCENKEVKEIKNAKKN